MPGVVLAAELTGGRLVVFEGGDPRRPYVIGGLWNGNDKPPEINLMGVTALGLGFATYLGELGSQATAVSLPLINAAGILQVSPGSPYVGLTSSRDAGQDDIHYLNRFQDRLQLGDPAQALAQVALMRSLHVRKVYALDDQDAFEVPLAELVAGEAAHAGIAVAAHDSIAVAAGSTYTGEVEKIQRSGADAVFFAGARSANPLTMAAGLASLEQLTPETFARLDELGERFRQGAAGGEATHLVDPGVNDARPAEELP